MARGSCGGDGGIQHERRESGGGATGGAREQAAMCGSGGKVRSWARVSLFMALIPYWNGPLIYFNRPKAKIYKLHR